MTNHLPVQTSESDAVLMYVFSENEMNEYRFASMWMLLCCRCFAKPNSAKIDVEVLSRGGVEMLGIQTYLA